MSTLDQDMWAGKQLFPDGHYCRLAQMVPQVKKSGGGRACNDREGARTAIQKTVDFLFKNPTHAKDVWMHIETYMKTAPTPSKSQPATLKETSQSDITKAATFAKLSDEDKCWLYLRIPGGPSETVLNKMDDNDKMALGDIFLMHFQLSRTTSIPVGCRDRRLLLLMLKQRQMEVGDRVKNWFDLSVGDDGAVDWTAKPLYKCGWANGSLTAILHISGDVATMDATSATITLTTHSLVDPFSDDSARFSKGGESDLHLRDFFPPSTGPHRFALDKKDAQLAIRFEVAKAILRDVIAQVADVLPDSDGCVSILNTRQKRLRDEALTKARVVGALRPKKTRMLSLTSD